eukprot:12381110-Alexandrium_andersonii.AAC.1
MSTARNAKSAQPWRVLDAASAQRTQPGCFTRPSLRTASPPKHLPVLCLAHLRPSSLLKPR